jgi:hypothetical protein
MTGFLGFSAFYVVLVYPIVALLISTAFEGYVWSTTAVIGVVVVLVGNAIAMGKLNRALKIRTSGARA